MLTRQVPQRRCSYNFFDLIALLGTCAFLFGMSWVLTASCTANHRMERRVYQPLMIPTCTNTLVPGPCLMGTGTAADPLTVRR